MIRRLAFFEGDRRERELGGGVDSSLCLETDVIRGAAWTESSF
jgi:hypothetical protein